MHLIDYIQVSIKICGVSDTKSIAHEPIEFLGKIPTSLKKMPDSWTKLLKSVKKIAEIISKALKTYFMENVLFS